MVEELTRSNPLDEEERADCLTLVVFLVTLHHGGVGWSAVCDCCVIWSYSLTFCSVRTDQ